MRIAIDARKLHDYGIGTYVRNLVRQLARQEPDTTYVLVCRPQDVDYVRALGPNVEPLVERAGHYSIREQLTVPLAVNRAKVDLFHAPHYVLSPFTGGPTVVTIHDCIHLRFPEYLPHRAAHLYARSVMALAARRADRIVTVSEASKADILQYLRVPESKVEVIYNALDERLAAPPTWEDIARVRVRYQLTSPFVLYTGNIKPHKNIDRLIEAFAGLRRRGHDTLKLLVIGDEISKYPNLRRLVHRFQLHQHVRFFGFVPDATLAVLYRLASLFVFPSIYEGFGFPPLEAMAAGTPVVASNASSLPEVVGDAALLVPPTDPTAIGDAMHRVLAEPALRADLVRRGFDRVKQFSWERSAARTREVYAAVMKARARG